MDTIGRGPTVERQVMVAVPYQQVYRNILAGFRLCLETPVIGNLYSDVPEGRVDVYAALQPPVPIGNLVIVGKKDGTSTITAVRRVAGIRSVEFSRRTADIWIGWASGKYSCE
jgi:hypothetical protein